MEKTRITIKGIAKLLNVSPSTISRALQNHPSIGKETTARVQREAKKLGYYPNSIASNLRRKKTKTIGVIIPRIDRAFQSSAISGIEEVASKSGYLVTILQSNNSYKREKENANMLMSNQVGGVIACQALEMNNNEHFTLFEKNNIPLVFFDRVCNENNFSRVIIDDVSASKKVIDHLVSVGCERIAHIAGNQKIDIFKKRLNGYKLGLKEHELEVDEKMICYTEDLNSEEGRICTNRLLKLSPRPDGIFCSNDRTAISAIQTIKKMGLNVPEDIAVVGFSNTPQSLIIEPSLTTIDDHAFEMGKVAANLLIRQIENPSQIISSEIVIIQNDLIVRDSTLRKGKHKN